MGFQTLDGSVATPSHHFSGVFIRLEIFRSDVAAVGYAIYIDWA